MSMMMCYQNSASMYPVPNLSEPGGLLGVAPLRYSIPGENNRITHETWNGLSNDDKGKYSLVYTEPGYNAGLNPVQFNQLDTTQNNMRAWNEKNQSVGFARLLNRNWEWALAEAGHVAEREKADKDSGIKCVCKVVKVRFRYFGSADVEGPDIWLNWAGNAGIHSINRTATVSQMSGTLPGYYGRYSAILGSALAYPSAGHGVDIPIK
jgi:hypothetical protein